MNKLIVAVCDTDDVYRGRFVTYLVEHKSEEIMVFSYSHPELFREEISSKKFDIAIIGDGFQEMESVLKKAGIPVIRMITTMPERAAKADHYGELETDHTSCIFKFQPMESVIHEMRVMSGGKLDFPKDTSITAGLEIIGIYSPVRHEMQTPFSVLFSVLIAEKRKVLYINFITNSEFPELFGGSEDYDMGDIVVQLRNQKLTRESFWRCTHEIEKVVCIPPFSNPEHLHELTWKDYIALLEFVKKETDFETVLIDFGEGMDRFADMLNVCTSIYCPVKSGYFYECKIRRFMEYIRAASSDHIEAKLHFAKVSFSAGNIRGGGNVTEQLLYSEFGDYVRNYLMGEQNGDK